MVWDEVEYAHGLQERKGGEYMFYSERNQKSGTIRFD